jgi:hypothetical protein
MSEVSMRKIPIKRQPKSEDQVKEHCAVCFKPTPYWTALANRTPGEQIALCPTCTDYPGILPTKRQWCDAVIRRFPHLNTGRRTPERNSSEMSEKKTQPHTTVTVRVLPSRAGMHLEGGIQVDVANGIPVFRESFSVAQKDTWWVYTVAQGKVDRVLVFPNLESALQFALEEIDRRLPPATPPQVQGYRSCEECNDQARTSVLREIADGLRKRGFWAPMPNAQGRWDNGDMITAVFAALESLRTEAVTAKDRTRTVISSDDDTDW